MEAADRERAADGRRAPELERWARVEWSALTTVARWLDGADAALGRAHAKWLGELSLDELVRIASRLGLATEKLADRLVRDPQGRARALREAGDGGSAVG